MEHIYEASPEDVDAMLENKIDALLRYVLDGGDNESEVKLLQVLALVQLGRRLSAVIDKLDDIR